MSESENRVVRQLRHDVDDVYELLSTVRDSVNALGDEQRQQSARLGQLEAGQREILELLRGQTGQ